MSDKEFQSYIDKAVEKGRTLGRQSTLNKIVIGVDVSVVSVAIITFFTSFYGVKGGVKQVTNEFIEFKTDTKEDIKEMKKNISENSNVNFRQEAKISYLEGKSERSGKDDKEKKDDN